MGTDECDRGCSLVGITGNVERGSIVFGESPQDGRLCCRFRLVVKKWPGNSLTVVGVNAFGGSAKILDHRIVNGSRLTVRGELMNRSDPDRGIVLEVRAEEVLFC